MTKENCFPDTARKWHIKTHNYCENIYETCTNSSFKALIPAWRGVGHKVPHKPWPYWQLIADGRGIDSCLCVCVSENFAIVRSTCSNWCPHIQGYMGSTHWTSWISEKKGSGYKVRWVGDRGRVWIWEKLGREANIIKTHFTKLSRKYWQ